MAINPETLNLDKNKLAALEVALGRIEKDHGKGAVMRGDEQVAHLITNVIPTGSLSLDLALGVGGLPRGRVTEIYGGESAGKSTLAIHIMAETQRMGGLAAYIDAEHALDPHYATACGLDLNNLLISQPDSAEQALDITEQLVRSGAVECRGHRQRRCLGTPGRSRRRHGRRPCRHAGPPHVPGPAQAHLHHQSLPHRRRFHQPDPREDRHQLTVAPRSPPAAAPSSSTAPSVSTSAAASR